MKMTCWIICLILSEICNILYEIYFLRYVNTILDILSEICDILDEIYFLRHAIYYMKGLFTSIQKQNMLKLTYFLKHSQVSRTNNESYRIKNAKFSWHCFYMNINIWGDFQICISVPYTFTEAKIKSDSPNLTYFCI